MLPKYGDWPKPVWQKQSDDAFIRGVDEDYHGDRKKAASDMALRGWQYLQSGDMDDAMRRFNQAWLLDKKSGFALWGMAAVEADRNMLDESMKLFEEAAHELGSNLNFVIDLSRVTGALGVERHDPALTKRAYKQFAGIYDMDPNNFLNLRNWAVTLLGDGKCPEAWSKVELIEAMAAKSRLDATFMTKLEACAPRPK